MASTTDLPIPVPSSASSVSWMGMAKSAGGLLTSTAAVLAAVVLRAAGYIPAAVTWLLSSAYRAAAWPLAQCLDTLRFLLSPITYTLSYTLKPLTAVLGFLARLRPLYTYLGSAAFIGILAGLVLKFASDYIVVVLSLDSDSDKTDKKRSGTSQAKTTSSSYTTATSKPTGPAITPPSTATASSSRLPKIEDNKSDIVQDDVWQWLDEFNPRQPALAADSSNHFADAPSLLHRQRPPGLLSLAILEESSSSEGGYS